MDSPDENKEIADIIARLERQFPDVAPNDVAALTNEIHHSFDGRPVRNFVAVIVEREAKERLKHGLASA